MRRAASDGPRMNACGQVGVTVEGQHRRLALPLRMWPVVCDDLLVRSVIQATIG